MGTTTTERPLPELSQLQQRDELDHALALLLEPTPTLHDLLVPQVLSRLETINQPLDTYSHLIDLCLDVAADWTYDQKARFVQGHPKIGAPAAKISALSGKEQSAGPVTPRVVLERLSHLNDLYSALYPGLIYITFVNGRTRGEIVTEMEERMGLEVSPVPLPDSLVVDQPGVHEAIVQSKVKSPGSEEWKRECDRALGDVWLIARARLRGLGKV